MFSTEVFNVEHINTTGLTRCGLCYLCCCCCRIDKVRLDVALELSKYLSKETKIMAVTQGFGELVPLYKLMEKRDMSALENQMKVGKGSDH